MPEYSDPFGAAVRDILQGNNPEGKRYSTREVERLSGGKVSRATAQIMSAGAIPSADLIAVFAKALGTNPNRLLRLAGKELRHPGYPPDED